MTNTLYTPKTLTNQALTAGPRGNRITLPVLLPVLLVTLLILSACGGSKAAPPATPTCVANPFSDTCINDATYASARDIIIKGCILGNNADSAECANAVARYPCIATPFIAECSAPTSTFAPYVETAQTERRNFCEISTNAATELCVTSVANICKSDIFDDLCPASTNAEQEAFCRMGTNAKTISGCANVVQRVCDGTQGLFETLCVPDVLAQQRHCRMGTNTADDPTNCNPVVTNICTNNPFDGICAGMFLVDANGRAEFCRTGNNLATYANDCTPIATSICETKLFDPICRGKERVKDQIQACTGSISDLPNVGAEASDCLQYVDGICGYGRVGGLNPHAEICEDAALSKYSTAIANVRVAFCQANVFHASCETGYITERVRACHLNGVPTDADPRCSAIIADNCPSNGTRNAACHTVVTLTAASKNNPITNYVEATADALELGFTQSNVPTSISDFTKGTIQLSDLADVDSPEGDNDGVGFATFKDSTFFTLQELAAIARIGYVGTDKNGNTTTTISRTRDGTTRTEIITVNSFRTIKSRTVTLSGNTEYRTISETLDGNTEYFNVVFKPTQRFYAGVLDGHTLGSPLSDNLKNAKWPAKIAIYNEVNLLCLNDKFSSSCGSAGNTGRLIEPAEFTLLVSFDGTIGSIKADGIPVIGDYRFAIDARFNDAGNIYGNTRLSVVRRSTRGPSTFLLVVSDGSITGLIGQKGLLAAFVSDGVDNRLGEYAGGLVATNPHNGDSTPVVCTATGTPFDARCADNDALRIMLCSTRHTTAMADFDGNCTNDSDVTDAICAGSGTHANPFDAVICPNPQPLVQQAFVDNCSNSDMSLRAGADCTGVTACILDTFTATCDAVIYAEARSLLLDVCNAAALNGFHDLSGCENARVNCASASPHANCGDLPTSYCLSDADLTITGDTSDCNTRVTDRCGINPLNPLCEAVAVAARNDGDSNLARAIHKAAREDFCEMPINANNPDCALTIVEFCDDASNTDIFNRLCLNRVHFRRNVIAIVCDDPNRDARFNKLCDTPHAYDIKRLEHCKTVDFKHAGCGVTISVERQAMLEIICGDDDGLRGTNRNDPICIDYEPNHPTNLELCGAHDRDGSKPTSPICEIESQALITVAVLCGQGFKDGTIGTIGTNPFSAICADELFNPIPCPTCADDTERTTNSKTARLEAQRAFCRQDTMNNACTSTITTYCNAATGADLFDDLCDGNDYLNGRTTHCGTSGFTHVKCGTSQANIDKAEDICGTEAAPGTNPFNEVCRNKTLSPYITPVSLSATKRVFCRATANVGETVCADTIARFCNVPTDSDVIFDDLCVGANYNDARLAYCIHPTRSAHAKCTATDANNKSALMTLCGDAQTAGTNPFSVACREAFSLRNTIDIACGGGRNSQAPLCTNENAIPAIDIVSITASQQGFCRGNLANTACEETIADFCDYAFGADILDTLCGGNEYYEELRLTNCLNPDVSHVNCRGTAGIVATLCPTDGDGTDRHELCPAIVDHALYLTPVDEFDDVSGGFVGSFNFDALEAVGVIDKTKVHTLDYIRNDDYDVPDNVERAIGFVTDAGATLIKGTTTGLNFGTLPPANTVIRNGGDPIRVEVSIVQNANYKIDGTNYGYALGTATINTRDSRNNAYINGETKLYAGLLTYSNFGAPTFDNASTAIWNATMNLRTQGGYATASANFDLNINFISQRIRTHATRLAQFNYIGAFFSEPQFTTLTGRLTIDASFTRLGLIYGAINIQTGFLTPNGDFIGRNGGDVTGSAGTLVGRISDTRLIGAFASNAGKVGSLDAYAGGFTATPSATPSPTSFTAGGTDDLTLTGKTTAAAATDRLRHPLGITSNAPYYLTGSTTNGFALASENIADGGVKLYAGILTGTDLGNPLFDNGATGIWNAKLNLLMFGNTATADFDLNVDFNTRTIETLADNPAQFTFADVEYEVIQRSAGDSAVTPLIWGANAPVYLKDIDTSIDARVPAGETIIDCTTITSGNPTGTPLAVGEKIPLCEGGGRPIYAKNAQGYAIRKNGIPLIETTTATASTTGRLTVKGRFSSTGKISGTTNIQIGEAGSSAESPGGSGTLTGLIGEAGLVAAFISDADGRNPYAGGFTATAGDCTIGGTPFNKTSCPDTNINARNLRLQLCIDRDPAATADFATNCAGDTTITALVCTDSGAYANPFDAEICPTTDDNVKTTFVNSCFADAGHADACTTGTTGACIADPYNTACSADYVIARPNHMNKCGMAETENRQDPTCAKFRTFLAGCAVASPDVGACSTVVNTYCFAGAGRTTGGAVTCANLISDTCDNNPFNRRCTDSGLRNTHAYAQDRLQRCSGDLDNLRILSLSASVCNTPELSGTICGTPTSIGTDAFATICSNALGNPYFETAQLEVIQATFCRQSVRTVSNIQRCNGLASPGTVKYWRLNAIHHVEAPVLNNDGTIKTEDNPITRGKNPVTKIVRLPLNIIPANLVRQRNPLVNYIVGGTTELDLGGAPNPDPELDTQGNIIPSTVITNTPTSIENRGGLTLFDLDNTKDTGSGFAFAKATFATRNLQVTIPGGRTEAVGQFDHIKLYTGLLADTDVGAPLSDIQTEAEWTARLDLLQRGVGSIGDPSNEHFAEYNPIDFTLLVSFYGIGGTIKNKDPIVLVERPGNKGTTFTIDGYFTDRGVIYGGTSVFSRISNVANTNSDGSLTGLIGADGAVAAFVGGGNSKTENPWGAYVGGFVALPPATPSTAPRADFAAWLGSFQSPNIPLTRAFNAEEFASANDKPYFIQGHIAQLNASNDTDQNRPIITLTLDNQFDDGNIFDGVTYLEGTGRRIYAGLLLGTDLGAPVTGTTGTTAQWSGVFQSSVFTTTPRRFALTVGFTADGGTLDALLAPEFGTNRNAINGTFDAKGIITGDVIGGNYSDNGTCVTGGLPTITDACFTNNGARRKAKLTGLIGEQGAVAAFIADDSTNIDWAGGFVAAPPTPNYITWYHHSTTPLGTTPNTSTPANQFLEGTKTGLLTTGTQHSNDNSVAPIVTTVTLADNKKRGDTENKLRGDAADGFAFFRGYIPSASKSYYYAGILSGTNLGAPLTGQPSSIIWRGHINLAGIAPLDKPFDLTVKLGAGGQTGGGTLSAFVPFAGNSIQHYKIDAEFDSNGIIITGDAANPNIVYDEFTDSDPTMPTTSAESHTGILSGIIGEEGVVAAFISNPHNSYSFGGGLVAVPYFCVNNPRHDHCMVDDLDWLNSFSPLPPADRTTSNDIFGGFLNLSGGTAKIDAVGLKTEASGDTDSASVKLPRPGDAEDAVVYISGFKGANNQAFVGILADTDLGAPLVEQPTAEWPGFYYDSTVPATAQNAITFSIDFSMRDINVVANSVGAAAPTFDLEFNSVGVITGTVTKNSIAATARGLIGQEGLVGGFMDIGASSGNVFHGGFVANNPDTNN